MKENAGEESQDQDKWKKVTSARWKWEGWKKQEN